MVELIKLKKDAGQLKFERRLKINQIFNDKEGTTLLVDSLNNRFMALETGTYMLHIFNRNPSQSALINVIANSSRPINLRFRREK